jgi:hypothetical protein
MSLFKGKTKQLLETSSAFQQPSEQDLLLVNGGIGCYVGSGTGSTTSSSSSTPPQVGSGSFGASQVWGSVETIFYSTFDLSSTVW